MLQPNGRATPKSPGPHRANSSDCVTDLSKSSANHRPEIAQGGPSIQHQARQGQARLVAQRLDTPAWRYLITPRSTAQALRQSPGNSGQARSHLFPRHRCSKRQTEPKQTPCRSVNDRVSFDRGTFPERNHKCTRRVYQSAARGPRSMVA